VIRGDTTGVSVTEGTKVSHQTKAPEEKAGAQTFASAAQPKKAKESKTPKYMLLAGAGLLIGTVSAGLIFSGRKVAPPKQNLEYVELLPPDLQAAVKIILDESVQESLKVKSLAQLTDSDSPATFSVLSSLAKFPAAKVIRTQVVGAIAIKLKDLGLGRSGEIIKGWSDRIVSTGQDPAVFSTFSNYLKACDLTLPLTARRDAIHRASVDDASGSLQLAAALSLDDPDEEHFVPVLRQLILGEEMLQNGGKPTQEGDYKSVAALGLSSLLSKSRTLTVTFEKDILSLLPTASDDDLKFMLNSFANVESPLIYDAANEALRRRMVTGIAAVPMKSLSDADRITMSKANKLALINFSIGHYTSKDIDVISRWTNREFESVLLSVCALTKDRDVALEAFDVLAGRNVDSEPAHELIKWFRNPIIWKNRKELANSLGILGLYKMASDTQIGGALDPLMPYAASGKLFEIVINLGEPRLIRMTMERVAPITSSDLLLALIKHADRSVRIGAVRALQGRNEVQVLQDLVRGYEVERDPEVRKVYEENHWVVKNRG